MRKADTSPESGETIHDVVVTWRQTIVQRTGLAALSDALAEYTGCWKRGMSVTPQGRQLLGRNSARELVVRDVALLPIAAFGTVPGHMADPRVLVAPHFYGSWKTHLPDYTRHHDRKHCA